MIANMWPVPGASGSTVDQCIVLKRQDQPQLPVQVREKAPIQHHKSTVFSSTSAGQAATGRQEGSGLSQTHLVPPGQLERLHNQTGGHACGGRRTPGATPSPPVPRPRGPVGSRPRRAGSPREGQVGGRGRRVGLPPELGGRGTGELERGSSPASDSSITLSCPSH